MPASTIAVKFEPLGKTVHVAPGTTVRDAAVQAGFTIDSPCGGQGTCGKCRVQFTSAAPSPNAAERSILSPQDLDSGFRLACQARLHKAATVEVPDSSMLGVGYQILSNTTDGILTMDNPSVRAKFLELPCPSQADDIPDLDRMLRELGAVRSDVSLVRELPGKLREARFSGTAILAGGRLIEFIPGNTVGAGYAVAFDIGTTTLVGSLHDADSGALLAKVSRMNPQIGYGDDVLSRILHAREHDNGLETLRNEVVDAVNEMVQELADAAHVSPHRIHAAAFAGNTTMQHLLAGVSPSALGEVPFVPAFGHGIRCRAADLGVAIHPRGDSYVLPVIGGFVGGDTVAGILVTGLLTSTNPVMFIDIGTNGEIVLFHDGCVEAASCAAGPAFEGACIRDGMRAAAGAIDKVFINSDVTYHVIGDEPAAGLCGSALIDALAGLLQVGVVTPEGFMLSTELLSSQTPRTIRERLVEGPDGLEFVVANADATSTGRPISLTHRDVRELQLATAAIRAGAAILLKRAGLSPAGLDRFLIAGGFGNYLRLESAQRLGLLPHGVNPDRFAFVGNSSLAGAQMAALSLDARDTAESIARRTTHVDLSLDTEFQAEYVNGMMFPPPAD